MTSNFADTLYNISEQINSLPDSATCLATCVKNKLRILEEKHEENMRKQLWYIARRDLGKVIRALNRRKNND